MLFRKGVVLSSLAIAGLISCAQHHERAVPESTNPLASNGLVVPQLANDNYKLAIAPVYINIPSQPTSGTNLEVVIVDKSVRVQNGDLCLTMMNDVYAKDNDLTWLPCEMDIQDFNFPKQNFNLLSHTAATAEIPDVNAVEAFYLFTVLKDAKNAMHAFVLSFGEGQDVNLKYVGSPETMIKTLRDETTLLPALLQRVGNSLRVFDKEMSRREFCFPATVVPGEAIKTETQGPNFGIADCALNLNLEETNAWVYYQAKANTFMGNLYDGYQIIRLKRPGETSNCLALVNGAFDYKNCDLAHQNEIVHFMYQNTKYATGYNSGVFEVLHTLLDNQQFARPDAPQLLGYNKDSLVDSYGQLAIKSWGEGSVLVPTLLKGNEYILLGQDYEGRSYCVSTQSSPTFYSAANVEFKPEYCQAFQIDFVQAF